MLNFASTAERGAHLSAVRRMEAAAERAPRGFETDLQAVMGKPLAAPDLTSPRGIIGASTGYVRTLLAGAAALKAEIQADQRLSALGQREKIDELAGPLLAEIGDALHRVQVAAGEAKGLQAKLEREVSTPPHPALQAAIWARIGEIDPLHRLHRLTDAAEAGDAVTVGAALAAPPFLELIDGEQKSSLRRRWAELRDPAAAAELAATERAAAEASTAVEAAQNFARELLGQPKPDPLRALQGLDSV